MVLNVATLVLTLGGFDRGCQFNEVGFTTPASFSVDPEIRRVVWQSQTILQGKVFS